MRQLALMAAVVALSACGARGLTQDRGDAIAIDAQSVPMNSLRPSDDIDGAFRYAGGLWLRTRDSNRFGGLSDLKIDPQGDLTAETDEGALLRAHIVLDGQGRLQRLDHATLAALTGATGAPLNGKAESDAEGVAVWPNGDLMVSFERHHRIWLYPFKGGPPQNLPMPHVHMPNNEGMEGLTLATSQCPDAYWVGIEAGSIWLCRLTTECRQWTGLPSPPLGFRLTGLSETPAGDLVVLHHSFNPFNNRSQVLATIVAIPSGPRVLAHAKAQLDLEPPLTVDNFEGVAAVRSPGGGLRLYLISDDNFSDKQRTLLLAFDWVGPGSNRNASPSTH